MMLVSLPFLIATIFCLFRRSNRIRYSVRRDPKEGKEKLRRRKATPKPMKKRQKLTGKNVLQQRQQALVTGLMNQVQQQKRLWQQNLQVMLTQQNKVFIALLENSKRQ